MKASHLVFIICILIISWVAGCAPQVQEVLQTVEVEKPVEVVETVIVEALAEAPAPKSLSGFIDLPTPLSGIMEAVAAGPVDVRSGPGMDYPSYGQAASEDRAMVLGISPDKAWYLVYVPLQASPSGIGWVSAGQVWIDKQMHTTIVLAPPPSVRIDLPTPEAGKPQLDFSFDTMIYLGPGNTFPALGVASGSASAEALGKTPDAQWYLVKIPTNYAPLNRGYVSAAGVKVSNAESLSVYLPAPVEEPIYVPSPELDISSLITVKNVSVRSGPGKEYPSLGLLWSASRAEVLGISADSLWYAVRLFTKDYPGGVGWVSAASTIPHIYQDVAVIKAGALEAGLTAELPLPGDNIGSLLESAQVLSGPGLTYNELGILPAERQVILAGQSADMTWIIIRLSTQVSPSGYGWVKARSMQLSGIAGLPVLLVP